MVEGFGDEESPEIEFGNVSHAILESLLMGENLPGEDSAKPEENACARVAFDYVQERWQAMGTEGTTCLTESKVSIDGHADLWGSADVILYNEDVLEIIDLKTGVGTYVDETTSGQLKAYAQGAIETLKIFPKEIRLTIVQPRYWGNEDKIRTLVTTLGDLAAWTANILIPAAIATDNPIAEGTATERCKHCAGRHTCEYRDRAVASSLVADPLIQSTMEVEEMDIRSNKDAVIYDNERLSEILMMLPVIREYCTSLEEHALEILMKGEKVPGYKVVASGGRSNWLNTDDVEAAIHGTRISKDAHKQVLKTPKQILALKPSSGLKKKLEGLIGHSDGGRKLALESSKGESIVPAFDAVPQQETPAELPAFLQ